MVRVFGPNKRHVTKTPRPCKYRSSFSTCMQPVIIVALVGHISPTLRKWSDSIYSGKPNADLLRSSHAFFVGIAVATISVLLLHTSWH